MKNISSIATFVASSLAVCLLACASLTLHAQTTNFTPIDIGSVNVGSTITKTITIYTGQPLWDLTVAGVGKTQGQFGSTGGTCVHLGPATCTIDVVFAPLHANTQYGAIIATDVYQNIVYAQLISGTGIAPEASFSPGNEVNVGTFPNLTGIAIAQNGLLEITTGPYTQGGSLHNGSLCNLFPHGPLAYDGPYCASFYADPQVWTDQIGNSYVKDSNIESAYLVSLNTVPLQRVPTPVTLAANLSRTLFLSKPGDTNIYQETPTEITRLSQNLQQFTETAFATGSNVWTDWFGNVFVFNNGQFTKYLLQTDGSYVPVAVLQSLSSNLTVDGYGNLYGSIDGQTTLYKETLQPNGAYVLSSEIPVGTVNPGHLTIDELGNLFYDKLVQPATAVTPEYRSILKEDFTQAPALTFASTRQGSTSSDSGRVVTITNHGNVPLQFSDVIYPLDFPEAPGAVNECRAGTSLLAEESCTLTINFAPVISFTGGNNPVTLSEVVKIITNTLNKPSTEQDLAVSGPETSGAAATPVFTPVGGDYNDVQWVAISSATPGATIYYTLNGTTPTKASRKYTGPVAVRNSYTLKAVAFAKGSLPSNVASAYYHLTIATPVISLASGTYSGTQTVTVSSATTGARFVYTTNGTNPGGNARLYTGPITVSASETLKVMAFATGYTSSPIVSARYTIQ